MGMLGAINNFGLVYFGQISYRMTVAALALPLIISGCASVRGFPDRLIESDKALNDVRDIFKPKKIEDCNEKRSNECRNLIVSAGMIGIDINFSEFERKLFKEGREVSFLTTVTTLGLTTAGAMTGTAVLSGIATGIVGSKEAFDKEILSDQAKNAIHTQMRALRQRVANRIRYGMTRPFDEYSLAVALIDIEEYYNAGTLLGAFIGITASAGQQIDESEVNKNRVLKGEPPLTFSPLVNRPAQDTGVINGTKTGPITEDRTAVTDTSEIMKKWLLGDKDKSRRNKLQNWIEKKQILDSNGFPELPEIFAKSKDYEDARKMAIDDKDLKILDDLNN